MDNTLPEADILRHHFFISDPKPLMIKIQSIMNINASKKQNKKEMKYYGGMT